MNFGGSFGGRSSERIIVRRRAAENKLAQLQQSVQQNFHLDSVARWQQSSQKLAQTKQLQRQSQQMNEQSALALNHRRQKLKVLLLKEEQEFQIEIDNKSETFEARRLRLEQRAKKLRSQRLAKREEFVRQQQLKQFREQCDELRLNHGQNLTLQCHQIRTQQIKDRESQIETEKKQDQQWLSVWQKDLNSKIEREQREQESKHKRSMNTALAIKQQMQSKQLANENEQKLKQESTLQRIQELRNLNDEKLKKEELLFTQRQSAIKSKRAELEAYQLRMQQESHQEKLENKQFIQQVLTKERMEDEQNANKKENVKSDVQQYLSYLENSRARDAEREQMLDKLREQELESEWIKREQKWKKEELARQQLLSNVIQHRNDQIAYKQQMGRKTQQFDQIESHKIQTQLAAHSKVEQAKSDNRLKYNQQIQQFLAMQISDKQEQASNEKSQLEHEYGSQMRATQSQYELQLQQEMSKDKAALESGQTIHHYPRTSANWGTY